MGLEAGHQERAADRVRVTELAQAELLAAYQIRDKQARSTKLKEVYAATSAKLEEDAAAGGTVAADKATVGNVLFDMEAKIVRSQILDGEPRIDGRDTLTVRPISIRTGVLPRTHGSALFTRGETRALVERATLGTKGDEQNIDALEGEYRERFMLHYNMLELATGETGRVGSPKRRENRSRPSGQARAGCMPAERRRIRLPDSRRVGNHRIERFVVDGFGAVAATSH